MAPKLLLYAVAKLAGKENPVYTGTVMKLSKFLDKNNICPNVSSETMRSCHIFLLGWWLLLFYLLARLPSKRGKKKHENVDRRNKNLLKTMHDVSTFLLIGIYYFLALDFLCTLYEKDKANVTFWDVASVWGNKSVNGELLTTIVHGGVRDYGVVKQEPIAMFLSIGILLVIRSWFLLLNKIIRMGTICLWEFMSIGIGGAFYIRFWFVKYSDITLVTLSQLIPLLEYVSDGFLGWAFSPKDQEAT